MPAHALADPHGAERHRPDASPRRRSTTPRTIAWKDAIVSRLSTGVGALLKKAGVRSLRGRATIVDGKSAIAHADTGDQRIACEHLVIATGSEPLGLAALPFDGEDVLSSTEALALTKVPETLAVVGAGYIGMELGMAFAKLGAKVTIVEALPKILPLYDEELTQPVARRCADLGIDTLLGARARGFAKRTLKVVADGDETGDSPPTRFWSRSGGARARSASASNASTSPWRARSSASTTAAPPRCATSGRSAT